MSKQSAGILVFRRHGDNVEVLLVHPAGPFWGKKDKWSIPKGELDDGEDLTAAAFREFKEEVGIELDRNGRLYDLGSAKQGSSKVNYVWALEADPDLSQFHSESFTMEWPPKSGNMQEFPEVDRAEWFGLSVARRKVFKAQTDFIDRLAADLDVPMPPEPDQQSLL